MSKEPPHDDGAHTIRASKGGGTNWLLVAVAAAVLAGTGYYAWSLYQPNDGNRTEIAYNDDQYASEPLRAGPLDQNYSTTDDDAAVTDDNNTAAAPASTPQRSSTAAAPARRTTTAARAEPAEATIGVTPASVTAEETIGEDTIVIPAPRRPIWARAPSPRRLTALYPTRALEDGREGEASLACTVQNSGSLDCVNVESTPGFSGAAMRVSRTLRHAPTRADGTDAAGTPVNLRVVFRLSDDDERGRRYASR